MDARLLCLHDARHAWSRLRGWRALPRDGGLHGVWLRPCCAVHTWGLREPLDLCFLDRCDQALRFCPGVPVGTWRWCPQAYSVLEAPAGLLCGPEGFGPWRDALRQLRQGGGRVWVSLGEADDRLGPQHRTEPVIGPDQTVGLGVESPNTLR